MKPILILAILLGFAALVVLHGYWYSTSVIEKYVQRCGAYPTLDEAIRGNMLHNGHDPAWFEEFIKSENRKGIPFTWYVIYRVRPEFRAAYDQAPRPSYYCGGSFYEHTRLGWVGMPEHMLNAFGYLDLWMKVFHLYGEDS